MNLMKVNLGSARTDSKIKEIIDELIQNWKGCSKVEIESDDRQTKR